MIEAQRPMRALYDAILNYEGEALFSDVVSPWLNTDGIAERLWLQGIANSRPSPTAPLDEETSFRLYALSRILDMMRLHFAPNTLGDAGWGVRPVTVEDYRTTLIGLGLEPFSRAPFHPFHHEIVAVDQDLDAAGNPKLKTEIWPGARLGPIMIARAGCRIESGTDTIVKEIAERSTLYWAFARNNRETRDLSNGWGSNSQWRTDFRLDVEIDGWLHYNIRERDPDPVSNDLSTAESLEVLRYRCFVSVTKPDNDLWPYDRTHHEQI